MPGYPLIQQRLWLLTAVLARPRWVWRLLPIWLLVLLDRILTAGSSRVEYAQSPGNRLHGVEARSIVVLALAEPKWQWRHDRHGRQRGRSRKRGLLVNRTNGGATPLIRDYAFPSKWSGFGAGQDLAKSMFTARMDGMVDECG